MYGEDRINIFDIPLLPITEELTTVIAENKNVRIERIISTGQNSGWYDQNETEFFVLLQGTAKIEFDHDEIVTLCGGDTYVIPPHVRHKVVYTSTEPPCIWLCVFWE